MKLALVAVLITTIFVISCANPVDTAKLSSDGILKKIKSMTGADLLNEMKSIPLPMDAIHSVGSNNISVECMKYVLSRNISQLLTYVDASGKLNAGFMQGGIYMLGAYDECMSVPNTKYCMLMNIQAELLGKKINPNYGICVPSVCSEHDIKVTMNALGALTGLFTIAENPTAIVQYGKDMFCSNRTKSYSYKVIIMLTLSGIILTLCLLGTITEVLLDFKAKSQSLLHFVPSNSSERNYEKLENLQSSEQEQQPETEADSKVEVSLHGGVVSKEENLFIRFLLCFSIPRNIKAILDTNLPNGAISSLNGIRFISLTWVILGHTIAFEAQGESVDNLLDVLNESSRFTFQAIENAVVSVDTFFFLSGLLVGYLSFRRFMKSGSLPLGRFYVHRYIRLTVLYAFLIFFLTYVYPIMGDGPRWFTQGPDSRTVKSCEKYWWTHLLYINNFFDKDGCFAVAWYLANDMQFYVISPILLYLMYRFKWVGTIVVSSVVVLASFIVTGVLIGHYDLYVLFHIDPKRTVDLRYFKYVYAKPYCRIQPYIVGLFVGYLLTRKHQITGQLKHLWYSIGWIAALGLGLAMVYGPYSNVEHSWSTAENILYGSVFRFVWACCIGWIVYACHYGYGGWVNSFLSWKLFIPLSRLTYAAYLIHVNVMLFFYSTGRIKMHYTDINLAFNFVSVTVISYTCAFILAVCIEFPAFNLEKLVFKF